MDPAELRRRNFIPPSAFPYTSPTGEIYGGTYEIADLPGVLEKALALADWKGFPKRRAQSKVAGKLRGIGISPRLENTGLGNAPQDEVEIQLDASGTVTAFTVAKSQGQESRETYAQIVADALEIPRERVKIVECAPGTRSRATATVARAARCAGRCATSRRRSSAKRASALAGLELQVEPSQVEYAAANSGPRIRIAY